MTGRQKKQQKGSALIIVLGIIVVVTITAGAMSYTAGQQMHAAKITREMLKARLIAESGLNKAYNTIKGDFSKIGACAQSGALGEGTYAVRVVSELGGNPNRAQLISEGQCGIGRAVVSADLENIPLRTADDDDAGDGFFPLKYDLLVGGELFFSGNPKALFTDIFSNGPLEVTGSPSFADLVSFMSSLSVTIKHPKKITGPYSESPNQPPEPVSSEALTEAIDAFKAYAQENGAVYASGADIPAAPPGGVAYCTGDATGWSNKGTGCFIFEGNVTFQGSGVDIKSVDGYPALIVLSASDVKFNSDAVIYGAILLPNAGLTANGHAEIHGAILAGQTVKFNGTADFYPGDAGQGFNLPEQENVTDNVIITAWH